MNLMFVMDYKVEIHSISQTTKLFWYSKYIPFISLIFSHFIFFFYLHLGEEAKRPSN